MGPAVRPVLDPCGRRMRVRLGPHHDCPHPARRLQAGQWNAAGEPTAWIWGIAIRRLIGVLRHRSRWSPVSNRGSDASTLTTAEDVVLFGVAHGDLAGAIDSLPVELRAVVQATVLDGLTTREAARLLGIPPGTVKTRMMRARIQLRGALT